MASTKTHWSAILALLHPAWWLSLFVLLLNDHVLKGSGLLCPVVIGKLSDFAGMLVAPALLAALLGRRNSKIFAGSHLAVGVVFTSLKLSTTCANLWRGLGAALGFRWSVVCDKTDLVALPMLALSMWLFGSRLEGRGAVRGAWQRTLARAAIATGLLAVTATSRPPPRSPVLTPMSVYVGEGSELKELDRVTGRVRRVIDPDLSWHSQPRIAGNLLYSMSGHTARAYDLSGGCVRWEQKLGNPGIVYVDDKQLFARSDEVVWALDAQTGAVLWQVSVPNRDLLVTSDRIVVNGWDDTPSVYARSNGRPLMHVSALHTALAVLDDTLYGLEAGRVFALDPAGAIHDRSDVVLLGGTWATRHFPAKALLLNARDTERPKAYYDDLVALDPAGLGVLWRVPEELVAGVTSRIVLTTAGIGCPVTAREAASGVELWRATAGCGWGGSLAADDSLVVTYVRDAQVSGLDPATGAVRWISRVE
jgi:outer membrane protein assembly factor BamB